MKNKSGQIAKGGTPGMGFRSNFLSKEDARTEYDDGEERCDCRLLNVWPNLVQ